MLHSCTKLSMTHSRTPTVWQLSKNSNVKQKSINFSSAESRRCVVFTSLLRCLLTRKKDDICSYAQHELHGIPSPQKVFLIEDAFTFFVSKATPLTTCKRVRQCTSFSCCWIAYWFILIHQCINTSNMQNILAQNHDDYYETLKVIFRGGGWTIGWRLVGLW